MREPRHVPDTTGPLQRLADAASGVPVAAAAAIVAGVVGMHDAITNKAFAGTADYSCDVVNVDTAKGTTIEAQAGGWENLYYAAGQFGKPDGQAFIGVDTDGDYLADTTYQSDDGGVSWTDVTSMLASSDRAPVAYDATNDRLTMWGPSSSGQVVQGMASGTVSGTTDYSSMDGAGCLDQSDGTVYGPKRYGTSGNTYQGYNLGATSLAFDSASHNEGAFCQNADAGLTMVTDYEDYENVIFDGLASTATEYPVGINGAMMNFQPAYGEEIAGTWTAEGNRFYVQDMDSNFELVECSDPTTIPTSGGGGTDTGTDTGDTGADTGDTGTETGDTGETGSDTAETGDTGETGETAETGETGGSTEVVCAEESADGMYMPDQTICGPDGASATVKSEYAVYDSVEDLTIMSAADAWLDFQGEFDIDSTGYNGWTLYPDESAEGSYDLAVTDFAPPPSTQQYSTLRLTHGGLMAMDSEGNETHYQVLEDGTLQVTDSSGHVTNNEGNSVQLAGEPVEEDTGNLDTGDTGDTGGVDTNDTAVDTNDSADKETADTAGWGQNPDTGNGSGGCNCATAVDTSSSGLKAWVLSGIAALSLLARRRK